MRGGVIGLYFGLSIEEDVNDEGKYAYAFDASDNGEEKDLIWFSLKLLEFILCGNQASVKRFERCGNEIIPIYKEKEFSEEVGTQLDEVAEGAERFCEKFKCFSELNGMRVTKSQYLRNYVLLIKKARLSTCNLFKDFNPLESSGDTTLNLFPKHGLSYYVLHVGELKKDIWKSGNSILFLKALLKIPLPYYKLRLFLQRFK